jgi:CBS domain-containing protein
MIVRSAGFPDPDKKVTVSMTLLFGPEIPELGSTSSCRWFSFRWRPVPRRATVRGGPASAPQAVRSRATAHGREDDMKISDVLRSKGTEVVTISPDDTVRHLLGELARHRVGALLVVTGDTLHGVVSERDVVRRLHTDGDGVLDGQVRSIMTTVLHVATSEDTVDGVMRVMTDKRVRHLPVLDDGALVGIVSIGDLVNQCITELRIERDQLTAYISG